VRSTLPALAVLLSCGVPLLAAERIGLTVTETAGLRRFGYPVEVVVPLPKPVAADTPFRLVDAGGKPVAAQISPHEADPTGVRAVVVDSILSCGPKEARRFALEYGAGVTPTPAENGGVRVEEADGEFRVTGGLTSVVPKDGKGLLRSVAGGKTEYLRPDSAGLLLVRGKEAVPFRADSAKVLRQGAFAAAVRLTGKAGTVDLTFPRSKSWVRADWTAEGPDDAVPVADLNLLVEGEPTLVDFGAASMVYSHLKPGESAELEGKPARVLSGKADRPPVLAEFEGPAEGWAHVMDRRRCTAVGVVGFGAAGRIRADADGRLRLRGDAGRRLTFYLHFVPMPVQVGALTSPQSMLAPLVVRVGE
jgi:hypothetical protein